MSVDTWAMLASAASTLIVGGIAIPACRSVVQEVLKLRNDQIALRGELVKLEQRINDRDADCTRHQNWLGKIQEGVAELREGQAEMRGTVSAIAASLGVKHP